MTTALKIIDRAFSKAGIIAAETPLSDSEVEDGLDALNDILKVWNATGVLKGATATDDVNDHVNCQSHEEAAIKSELAKRMCGEYGKVVTKELLDEAKTAKREMLSVNQNLQDIDFPSTLPKGSGNYKDSYYDDEFFPDQNERNF